MQQLLLSAEVLNEAHGVIAAKSKPKFQTLLALALQGKFE
jgi:hypothetical protein